MVKTQHVIGVLAVLISSNAKAQNPPVNLASHRAVYELTLVPSDKTAANGKSIENATGRIAFDFAGDACDGYTMNYRQVMQLQGPESQSTVDLRTNTYESSDGKILQFKGTTESDGEVSEQADGIAERAASGINIKLNKPKSEKFTLSTSPLFPTEHMKKIIEAARSGQSSLSVDVYDGSESGKKVFNTLTIIGKRVEPGIGLTETPAQKEILKQSPRWPVKLSYYEAGEGERTPAYELAFELFDNGILRNLKINYIAFALNGELKKLEMLPVSKKCKTEAK